MELQNKQCVQVIPQFTLNFRNLQEVSQYCTQFVLVAMDKLNLKNHVSIYVEVDYELEKMLNIAQVELNVKYNTAVILVHSAMFNSVEQLNSALLHQLSHCLTIDIKRYQQAHGDEGTALNLMFDNAFQLIAMKLTQVFYNCGLTTEISKCAIQNMNKGVSIDVKFVQEQQKSILLG